MYVAFEPFLITTLIYLMQIDPQSTDEMEGVMAGTLSQDMGMVCFISLSRLVLVC